MPTTLQFMPCFKLFIHRYKVGSPRHRILFRLVSDMDHGLASYRIVGKQAGFHVELWKE